MIELPEPKDVEIRNSLLSMTDKSLMKDINRLVKKLNTRLGRLEKSGLSKYTPAYYRVLKWIKKNTPSKNETFTTGFLKSKSLKEKANYLTMLYHFENYKLTITDAKSIRENLRKSLKENLGREATYEEVDRVGDIMAIIYRDESNISDKFAEIFNSRDSREWATEHIDMTKEQAEQFLKDFDDYYHYGLENGLTSQDLKDFIDNYESDDNKTYYDINGVKIDKDTGLLINNTTEELIEGYYYDATSENIFDEQGNKLNVDDNGIEIPLVEFMRGKYGYI